MAENRHSFLAAFLDQREPPPVMFVSGEILVYTDDSKITITAASPQGIVSSTLLLNATIETTDKPMKGVWKAFSFAHELKGETPGPYTKVQLVLPDGTSESCDVFEIPR